MRAPHPSRPSRGARSGGVHRVDVVLGALAAGAVVALGIAHGWHAAPGVAGIGVVVAALVAPALVRIDVAERRLPNALTMPVLAVALACTALTAARGAWIGGAVALATTAVLVAMWWTGGMGGGDVKLGAALAFATAPLAWWLPLAGLAAAFVLGGAAGVAARVRGAHSVPFGPWLLAGSAVAIVATTLSP